MIRVNKSHQKADYLFKFDCWVLDDSYFKGSLSWHSKNCFWKLTSVWWRTQVFYIQRPRLFAWVNPIQLKLTTFLTAGTYNWHLQYFSFIHFIYYFMIKQEITFYIITHQRKANKLLRNKLMTISFSFRIMLHLTGASQLLISVIWKLTLCKGLRWSLMFLKINK
jgi:hypothetical protein